MRRQGATQAGVADALADLDAALAAAEQRTQEAERRAREAEERASGAERQLHDMRERYRTLVRDAGFWVWSVQQQRVPSEETLDAHTFAGRVVREVLDNAWTGEMSQEDRQRIAAAWREAHATKSAFEVMFRVRREDGNYRTLLARGVPQLDARGEVYEWVGTCTDMTEVHHLEHALAERVSQLEAVFNAIVDGIYVYDRNGHLIQTNTAAREINPHTMERSYRERPFGERIAQFEVRDAEGRLMAVEDVPVTRVLRGEVLTGEHAVDTTMRIVDGQEIRLNTTGAPVRDRDGQVVGAVIVTRDVTERHRLQWQTQEALDALLAMARALVGLPDGEEAEAAAPVAATLVTDTDERVARQLASLTRSVLGCSRVSISVLDERNGETLRPLTVVGLDEEMERQWWTTQRERPLRLAQWLDAESCARFVRGEAVALDMARPPYDALPNTYGIRTILIAPMRIGHVLVGMLALDHSGAQHEYTPGERRLAEAVAQLAALVVERARLQRERADAQARVLALEETNRLMNEFLAIAGHELRTPLTSTKANVQIVTRLLQRALEEHPDFRWHEEQERLVRQAGSLMERTRLQVERQVRLVNDLLDVARMQTGRLEIYPQRCDLGTIVAETVEEQRLLHPDRTITLELPRRAGDAAIMADADRIGQVVANFLTNALKYSAREQPVTVRLEVGREHGEARVSVRDRGPGLPAREREQVWERFYRAPGVAVRSGSGVGLGLGLHISKMIVERHGGQVGVESEPGVGCTFWFTLPLVATAAPVEPVEPVEQ